jgi:DNA-binding IscR family transcriptional regulator
MSRVTTRFCMVAQFFTYFIVTVDITTKLCYNKNIHYTGGTCMQFSSRLTIATHILLCIEIFKDDYKITSNFLAGSIHVNPVIVRNILGLLSSAGIVEIKAGIGGASLEKSPDEITMLDVFKAVEKEESLFHFHENPNANCPVGRNVHAVLDSKLDNIQTAMENELAKITLSQLVKETKEKM